MLHIMESVICTARCNLVDSSAVISESSSRVYSHDGHCKNVLHVGNHIMRPIVNRSGVRSCVLPLHSGTFRCVRVVLLLFDFQLPCPFFL